MGFDLWPTGSKASGVGECAMLAKNAGALGYTYQPGNRNCWAKTVEPSSSNLLHNPWTISGSTGLGTKSSAVSASNGGDTNRLVMWALIGAAGVVLFMSRQEGFEFF